MTPSRISLQLTLSVKPRPGIYLTYLFVKIYHTGLVGWLALAGVVLAIRRGIEPGFRFVLGWAAGLLLIFSLLPVSVSPLELIRKQANYIEIFVIPLALLAGWFLAQLPRTFGLLLGGVMIVSGILFSVLEQEVVRVVTVNGRAAALFADSHAGTPVFGPLTAQRQSTLERLLRGSLDSSDDIRLVADLQEVSLDGGAATDIVAYIIEDPQIRNWRGARIDDPLPERLRVCLLAAGQLDPTDLRLGRSLVGVLHSMSSLLPARLAAAATSATDPLWRVYPAKVYAVTRECARTVMW
jgi:hypothetical protein